MNKSDLISRSALLEKVQFRLPVDNHNAEVIKGCVDIARKLIETAPAVDAVEVKHGRWIDRTKVIHGQADYRYDCSVCGSTFWDNIVYWCYDFCPKCGADMRGDPE